jgi:hypothetical protein
MDLNYTHPASDDKRNVIYLVSGVKEEENHMPVAVPVRKTEIRVSYNFKGGICNPIQTETHV